MDRATSNGTSSVEESGFNESPSLDHALLESLFYNEMMMMDDPSSLLSSNLLSLLSADGKPRIPQVDPSMAAETDLLNDFGVAAGSSTNPAAQHVPQHQVAPTSWVPNVTNIPATLVPADAATPSLNTIASSAGPLVPASSMITHLVPSPLAYAGSSAVVAKPPTTIPAVYQAMPPANVATPAVAPAAPVVSAQKPEEEKRKKLVTQFSTLASRLGITLPTQVLQALSATAATTDQVPITQHQPPLTKTPLVAELEKVAEAAIATVVDSQQQHQKRPAALISTATTAEPKVQPTTSSATAVAAVGGGSSSSSAAYTKRRKKPRLSDCEAKVAELKSENELLKRHLHTITNQAHKLDQERLQAESRMKTLLQSGATTQEIDAFVQHFTEMYSDYGKQRHQELTFHLEQLQRLANPTNFTKMGLWTLGQQSTDPKRNPIAGMLQKELGITSQQGRKILEQRQKIQDVCQNIKECLALLAKLKALCEQKTKIFHDRLSKCREILTPTQVVKLLVWIDQHSDVLGKICPGWGSEQIRSKNQQK